MRIYTHGGRAHADDMLACAILISVLKPQEIEIVRTFDKAFPQLEAEDFVVDTGGVYDGKQHFDHHQGDDDVAGECAATLVAKHFAPQLLTDGVWGDYLKRLSLQDNKGLRAVETQAGTRVSQFLLMEFGLVKMFESDPVATAKVVAAMITDRMDFLKSVVEAGIWLQDKAEVRTVKGHNVLFLKENPVLAGLDAFAVNSAQAKLLDDNNVVITVNFDPRDASGKTRTLFRTRQGEDIGVDLTTATPAQVTFCHKGGFLLNFIPADDNEWERLIAQVL